ncbi:hypothetical protein ACKKBG_A26735 [Auxenochlorella protothecoides x Auxenochlorella symbiontica]
MSKETDTPLEFDDSRILDSPVLDETFYESDEFRMWEMKVTPCSQAAAHDWMTCPFAHAGEKAVRRAPRTHDYTGIACPDMKRNNSCPRGDRCPYSHNVFEYWLHPTRYRTQLCNDGPACRRRPCFFAHSLEQLRQSDVRPFVSPQALARVDQEVATEKGGRRAGRQRHGRRHSCERCRLSDSTKPSDASPDKADSHLSAADSPQRTSSGPHQVLTVVRSQSSSQPGPTCLSRGRLGACGGSPDGASTATDTWSSPSGRNLLPTAPSGTCQVGTEGTLPFMTRWSAPGRLASDPGEDTEATLVALLASLKVERTRHLGNTACTNHEVVISTLHQVLQQAKQAQRSLGHSASEGESSCGSPPWTRRLEGRDQVPAAYQDHLDGRGRKGSGTPGTLLVCGQK